MNIYTVYWLRDNTHTNPHTEGYIGITSRDPSLRLEEHLKSKDYIPDTYVFDILHQVDTPEEMCAIEESYRPQSHIGWNLSKGGSRGGRPEGIHTSGWTHTEEAKQKRSEMVSGEGNGMYGKKQSDKQKEAVSKALKGIPQPHKSAMYKERYANGEHNVPVMKGKDNPKSRAIYGDGQYWESIHGCAKELGVNHNAIRYRLISDKEKWDGWHYA